MDNDGATRVLLLRDSRTADTGAWRQLEQRLPAAERAGGRAAAPPPPGGGGGAHPPPPAGGAAAREPPPRCGKGTPYALIVPDPVLPDGGPYGLLGALIARH